MIREAESLTGEVTVGTAIVGKAENVVFSDGTTLQQKFESGELKGERGPQGIPGEPGKDGIDGIDGVDGKDGKNGIDGKDGINGTNGVDGKNGTNGVDGKDGKTPVKGVDYYTESDKNEMVNLVLSALPSSEEVSY